MNDDDDTGGGTIVIHPSPTGPAHAARPPFPASPPGQPLPADAGPLPTQVLPITELPSGPSAPLPAAGRPAEGGFRPAMTLPIPPHGASPSAAPAPQARYESQPPPGGHPGYPGEGGHPAPHPAPGYPSDGARAQPSGAPPAGPHGFQGSAPAPYDPRGSAANLPPPYPGHEPPRAQAAQRPMQLNDGPTEITRKSSTGTVVLLLVFALLIGAGIAGTLFILKRPASEVEPESTAGADTTASATATAVATGASLATTASATSEPTLAASGTARTSAPTTSVSAAPTEISAPTPPSSAPPGKGPEGAALAALDKLRAAVEHCTKNGTHVLPGTSPPIPDSFAKLKRGPYTPVARDFDSAFFHCSLLRLEQPMSFVLQWQLDEPSWRGTGVVWIDSDGDGEIDKAYSFYAQLKQKDEIQFAPVQPLDPKKRALIPR